MARPPQTPLETFTAHCRPQPAIPAVMTMLMLVVFPAMTAVSTVAQGGDPAGWMQWLIPLGIVTSSGLAVAAGFCSLFPHASWLLLAGWALSLLRRAGVDEWQVLLLYAGVAAVIGMAGVQLWRIRTRRFVPTIEDQPARDP